MLSGIFLSATNLETAKADPLDFQWGKTFGGTENDGAHAVTATSDGGYVAAGFTESYGNGGADIAIIKVDAAGNTLWSKTYGGTNLETARSVVEASDGGYAIAGFTNSYGNGGFDIVLLKTDASGNIEWYRTYGGANDDEAEGLVATADGGYAIVGKTQSYGAGSVDCVLVKTDASGNIQWYRTYGGPSSDEGINVVITSDGGYAITGTTGSYGAGDSDFWLIKTDKNGNHQWNQTYGTPTEDYSCCVIQTSDQGYAMTLHSRSYGAGGADWWIIKTDEQGVAPVPGMLVIPEYSVGALSALIACIAAAAVKTVNTKRQNRKKTAK